MSYNRSYYITDRAIEKLREKLAGKIRDLPGRTDRELGNSIDEAVHLSRSRGADDCRSVTYDYQGKPQICVNISDYFGPEIKLCAILAENESTRRDASRYAVITIADGDFIDKLIPLDAHRERGHRSPTMADIIPPNLLQSLPEAPRTPERLPERESASTVTGKPKDTRLITYLDRNGREQYEERLTDEAPARVETLIGAGIPAQAIRIWKPAKTRVRIELE